jgi:hypothetical protein
LFISAKCSTCFRQFLCQSSGAQKLYIQHLVFVKPYCYLSLSWRSWNNPSSGAQKLYIQHLVFVKPLLLPFAIMEELEQLLHDSER